MGSKRFIDDKEVMMGYIPNARELFISEPGKKKKVNGYYQGLLDKTGKDTLIGFDLAVDAFNNLFSNLMAYDSKMSRVLGDYSLLSLDEAVVNGVSPYSLNGSGEVSLDYLDLDDFSEEELRSMSSVTKVCLLFKTIANEWLEMERDELNTSLIEDMDGDEYARNLRNLEDDAMESKKGS